MIGSLKRQYVFVTPPKAGASSWRIWLAKWCDGIAIGKTHDWKVPAEYRGCTPFLPVRNPYDRCISLWWYACADPLREKKCHLYGCSFVKYMYRMLWFRGHPDEKHETSHVYMDLAMYADCLQKQMEKAIIVIHLDKYEEDLAATGFFTQEEIERYAIRNTSKTQPRVTADKFLSGVEEDLVWQYCQEEFYRFGYERLPRVAGGLRAW